MPLQHWCSVVGLSLFATGRVVAEVRDTTPARLVFMVQPSAVAANGTITPAVQVSIQDSSGQPVTSFDGTVTLAITDGTGNEDAELSGTTVVAAVAGVATFADLRIDQSGSAYTFTASVPGLSDVTSAAFDVTAASVAPAADSTRHLVFTVQPTSAGLEATITPPITVMVQDDSGRALADFAAEVTLALTDGTGNPDAELVGTTTVTAVAGIATFSDLSVDEPGTGFTLTATVAGLPAVASSAFDIVRTVDSTLVLAFTVQPSAVATGVAMSPAVVVTVQDSAGRPATGFTGEVTLEITEGTGNEDAELSGMTVAAVAGVATFTALRVDLEGKGYTLTASATGLPDATSAPFDVTAGAKPTLRATAIASEFTLDGKLDEPAWSAADSIVDLVTFEPEERGVPAGQTIVKVLVNTGELVIGVVCRDTNPAGIVSFSKARDADLESEDHVLIVLDPFQDGRSGYVFAVNPSGARFDGLVAAQGEEVNSDWDAVWEARAVRDGGGWSAEIRIPIRSLSFQKGLTAWGFNVQRRVQRLQETSRWSGASRDYEVYQTSRAGLLTDLPQFDFGVGLSIRPALVGGASRPAPDESREYTGDLSLDVTQKLGSNLLGSLTVNTDFAETEIDARQTNLTRFEILFPEKRSFFLEGSDIFEFGLGLDEDFLVPFFSRRIGVSGEAEDLVQIPLKVGGKVNGRVGNTNLGALAVRTGTVDSLGANATMGVVRVSRNVLDESSVGMMATFGDPLGRAGSWMAGADATYRTSEFRGDKNLLVGIWGLTNDREDLDGDKTAFGARIDYPNDLWDVALTYVRVGDAFQPSLGFVPRTGQILEVGGDYGPRPNWSLVRQMFYGVTYFQVTTLGNNWESYRWTLRPLDWQLESGDRVQFVIQPQGEWLNDPFEIVDGVLIPTGPHRWTRYNVGGTLAEKRRVSGEVAFSFGSFYEGHLATTEVALAVKLWPSLTLELSTERNSASLAEGDFTQEIYGGRLEFKYSSDFQISSFLQYDNESRSFGTNTRLRWTFHPLGDVFVVFNHNMVRNPANRFTFDSNQLLVKVQYAYRM